MTRPMQDSGQWWIGSMPDDWDLVPLGSVFRERKTTVSDADYEPLSVSMNGVVPRLDNVALTDNNDARKLVRAGDYVINSRSDRKGSGGLSDRDGSVSVISTVLTPTGVHPHFAHHLLRSTAFQEEFYRWGSGIVADLWSTRYPAMRRIMLPLPPREEQRAIADFLDRETAKIDALIDKQNQMIDLLRERRSAVRDRALLTGLEPGRSTKSTHNPWLPILPTSWHAVPTRRMLSLGPSNGVSPEVARVGDLRSLSIGAVRDGRVRLADEVTKYVDRDAISDVSRLRLNSEDILIVRGNGNLNLVGRAGFVDERFDQEEYIYPDLLIRVRTKPEMIPEFFVAAFDSPASRAQIELRARTTVGTFKITASDVRTTVLPVPPLDEQLEIVEYLRDQSNRIDALVAKTEESVALARERRAALITAAVTGQVDVRERVS